MNTGTTQTLRDDIEKMDKIHQLHILRILRRDNIGYTENANGIFINMSVLPDKVLLEIKDYLCYVELQQKQLDKIEEDKERYKKEFYKDNKANSSYS